MHSFSWMAWSAPSFLTRPRVGLHEHRFDRVEFIIPDVLTVLFVGNVAINHELRWPMGNCDARGCDPQTRTPRIQRGYTARRDRAHRSCSNRCAYGYRREH